MLISCDKCFISSLNIAVGKAGVGLPFLDVGREEIQLLEEGLQGEKKSPKQKLKTHDP